MVSTVRVLLLMVWELTISPVALYAPSSDSSATLRVSVATTGTCVVLWSPGSPRVEGSLYTLLSVCTIGCGPPLPGYVEDHNKMLYILLHYVNIHFYICHLLKSFVSLYNKCPWTPQKRFLLEKLVKKFPAFYEIWRLPISSSQQPTPCPYPGPYWPSPCPPIYMMENPLHYHPAIYSWVFQVVSSHQFRYNNPPHMPHVLPTSRFLICAL